MNNNRVIVDLEKYEALIRENEELKQTNKFLVNKDDEIINRLNKLEQLVMENNFYSWVHDEEPERCFNRYSEMLDLGITRRVMKGFIENKQLQKVHKDE